MYDLITSKNLKLTLLYLSYQAVFLYNTLGARDGFTQPIFYKRFDRFSL